MSKGSTPRPVDRKVFDSNYDAIFGKKTLEQQVLEDQLKPFNDNLAAELIKGNDDGK